MIQTTISSSSFTNPGASGATPTPHLERRTEFETLLSNYSPSLHTVSILSQTPLVTLTAPTATGRNTIINELVRTGRYHFLISDTTRPPRANNGVLERDGVEYFFRSEADVLQDIKEGAFVEAEIIHAQQVSGTSARELERAHLEGKIAIADVDIEGGIHLSELKPDTVTICLLPPTFNAWISRLTGRENIEPLNLYRRLRQATKVLRLALEHTAFIFVVNDNLEEAVKTVDEIAKSGVHHPAAEKHARQLAQVLYDQTVAYLREHAPDMVPTV